MEDKAAIVKAFLPVARMTRGGSDVTDLEYIREGCEEFVVITFDSGSKKKVRVTADSGVAMIRDITRGF